MVIPFRFYALSEEEQEQLRNNPRRCVALLRPGQPLADKLAATGGISAALDVDDERLLQGFHAVQHAHEGDASVGLFDERCRQAGLLPSDVGLLEGRLQTRYQQREPVIYEAEADAIMHQWMRNKEQDAGERGAQP